MRSAFLAVAAAMLIPLRAASSQAIQPKRGDRIRITAAPNALDNRIARVLSVRSDSLFLHVSHLDGSGSAFAWETGPLRLRSDCRG